MATINEKFTTVFTLDKFISGDVTGLKTNQYQKIGEFKVEAGQLIRLGAGNNDNQSDAYGRIYGVFKDNATTPAEIQGIIRFVVHSPQGRPLRILKEMHTSDLNTSATDVRLQKAFAEFGPFVSEDKKIVIELNPTAVGNGTLAKTNSTLRMHVTEGVA